MNRTRDPSQRGWRSTIEPPRQATSPASLFEILSILPPLHNTGIIQCPELIHRQQCRSRRANPNQRVNDVTSPAGRDLQLADHAECVVHWIYCSRSCRLVAGMHSTSFVLGKGVGCLWSVFCALVSNINRLLARVWYLLSAAFVVNSRHRTAAFTAIHWYASSIVVTRPPKLQVRSRRALWRFRRRSQN